ncbi:SEC-C metal-binding domain-containing protein [Vibrio tapetis]|uniref:Protein export cytoplasm protein SecA ATPase RNA helicase n=1 Tax=Vibrio tapetis subsp. tapetis TaxID=1671868 RepID=A0A2N8ZB74_9VIBR|nr:SEC-C metal-binding domain-containing protein [Vibrio tapetis]SON49138.1 Protein export cytoplasm protein SecA ATPase RNA helicase [Vibrio tapetis subsp. tapetis]
MYQIVNLPESWQGESAVFLEGAIFASNLATKPLQPEVWLNDIAGDDAAVINPIVVGQINQQYNLLKRSEYSPLTLLAEPDLNSNLAEYSQGFMSVWPVIETQWQEAAMGDGSLRMLQALLTTMMLAIDESQTRKQMEQAGIIPAPLLSDFVDQFDVMVMEVALAADEAMVGGKAQRVNPFKDIGRNDSCPCDSGKKYKQCCGK